MKYTQIVSVNKKEWFDPFSGICLLLGVFLTTYALELTYWTYDLDRITAIVFLSVVVGLLIGYANFSLKKSRLLIGLYAAGILIWQLIFSINDSPVWMDRLLNYCQRVANTTRQLIQNTPLDDGILFLTAISILFCVAGLASGFRFARYGKPWLPYSIFAAAIFTIQFYLPDGHRSYITLFFFTVCSILLIGRLTYVKRQNYWKQRKIREDREVSLSLVKAVALFAITLSFLSFGVPLLFRELSSSREETGNSIESGTTLDFLTNFFFPLRQPEGFGDEGFHSVMPLGAKRSLEQDPVFQVEIPDELFQSDIRFYWYGRSYAAFQNGIWQNTDEILDESAIAAFEAGAISHEKSYPFLFSYEDSSEIVFRLQETILINRPAQISFYQVDDGRRDIIVISDPGIINSGDQVLVEGGFNQPALDQLRQTGTVYPEWVQNRYLQLPVQLSNEIQSLSEEITSDYPAVVDKVLMITQYLRTNFAYTDAVDIPRGEDPIEWFLFTGKKGFCNYFASAEVIMLRTLGIPSRLVVGYAQGERVEDLQTYEVQINDSHSWVEVYFPDHGWVIFEPTPSQPDFNLIETYEPGIEGDDIQESTLQTENRFSNENSGEVRANDPRTMPEMADQEINQRTTLNKVKIWMFAAVLAGFVVFALVRGIFFQVDQNELPIVLQKKLDEKEIKTPLWLDDWVKYEKLKPVEKMFAKLKRYSRWILAEKKKQETPNEFLRRFALAINLEERQQNKFLDHFHQEVYGNGTLEGWQESEKIYRIMLLGIMIRKYKNIKVRVCQFFARRNEA